MNSDGLILEFGPGPSNRISDITINAIKILICKSCKFVICIDFSPPVDAFIFKLKI